MSRRKHQPTRHPQRSQQDSRDPTGNRPQTAKFQPERAPGRPGETAPRAAPESRRPRPGSARSSSSSSGAVWLYGSHACLAALANPQRYCRRLVLTREMQAELADRLPAQPQPEIADKARLDSLLPPGAVHQGVALQVEPLDDPGVESLQQPSNGAETEIVLALDQVTDPRNVGAILRSAAAFGVRALIVTDRHAPEATGAMAKAASGGLEVVPMLRVTNLVRALDLLAGYGFWRVGLDGEAERELAQAVSGVKRLVLVMGAEDEGLRRLTREHCDFLAKLPMTGAVESLNVSAAAAIALYEAARRQT
ncbi:23S rRNA (guanosine(2251)-2'-O)-methyltransferase RlmB [Ferrovibrio sp.]|uniref:23S rRNA (guanosine(2251)-2'-O)-methyltransferase RlmB n=1 Tax=Ferrovibrio sp. TaxID=1917215 RepID=UPI001B6C66BE|nr:23S rRNA (guanosine(2251)-2'-O)-methyltransferase RlmB [Ferrovibrio sp.]MBP7066608.1 23S rRNA (guanosine(2251)-2'-O)-methyltransferase RlmB [Ferrovibrio sp.]